MSKQIQVAIIGSQGVPAHYGGFESLVENILGTNCSRDIHYTVFCSSTLMDSSLPRYKGADLRYVHLNAHGASSIPYDIISIMRALRGFDAILILGVSGCISLPLLKHFTKARIIVNIDGHEYQRNKWSCIAKQFLRLSEAMAVKHADVVVADNRGIQKYVEKVYKRSAVLIPYGGNHVLRNIPMRRQYDMLADFNLPPGKYDLAICRIEPENNCHIILEAYRNTTRKLAFVGNWGHSEYSQQQYNKFVKHTNIMMLDSIYDIETLYTLRNNARCYIHGHSAGGTNPSLVEAMFFPVPILAFNVIYNRETTFDMAQYFSNSRELELMLERVPEPSSKLLSRARLCYNWRSIARRYEVLFR